MYKPRRVFRYLAREYQYRIERQYGEYIIRNVLLTKEFSFPCHEQTGQLNDLVAKKTREVIRLNNEMWNDEIEPFEEVCFEQSAKMLVSLKR